MTVEIVGERAGAPSEVAALAVQVSGAPIPLEAAVSPSPMRSEGLLEFATSRAGLLEVQLLDLAGRRVRQLSNQADAPAGWHRLAIDGRGDGGSQLKAGVYFYRIRAGEGTVTGRFVILR